MPRYRAKHLVEYGLLRAVTGLLNALPYGAALAVGAGCAALSWPLLRRRRRATEARLRQVLGDRFTPREARRLLRCAWRNLFFNGVEWLRMGRVDRAWVERHVECEGLQAILNHAAKGRGAIIAIPHLGNWELAGVGVRQLGLPLFVVARRQKNPLTDALINRMRERAGMEVYFQGEGMFMGILRSLRRGKVLAVLPDIRHQRETVGVEFLGQKVSVPIGMAFFARKAGVPIFAGCTPRVGWCRHHWELLDIIWPDPAVEEATDLQRMTQQVMNRLEQHILHYPDQYFWFNKRWVLGATAAPAAASPA